MWDSLTGTVGIYGGTLIVAVLSGFIPIINVELYLIAVTLLMRSMPLAIILGMIAAVGQMIAKVGIYKASAGAATKASPKLQGKIDKAQQVMEKWKDKPLVLTFVSATFGIPPFFIVSVVGGLLKLNFRAFMLIGFIGRSLRFVTIALLALLAPS